MAKIIGNTTATPNLLSDWNQNDSTKADYIKNKPTNVSDFENDAGYINTVDSELSTDSTNPVQNKAVAEAIDSLNTLVGDSSVAEQIQNALDEQDVVDHNHNELYYTKTQTDEKLSQKVQVQIITWEADD
jgi:hypothetical protein